MRTQNDPFLEAIAERIRIILARQPASTLCRLTEVLDIAPEAFQQLVQDRQYTLDTGPLLDLMTAIVREFAVDPRWLLTGKYDGAVHRRALLLGENRTPAGEHELREFVQKQYREARSPAREFLWSGIFGSRV